MSRGTFYFAHIGTSHFAATAAALQKLGGARVILTTVTDAGAMSAAVGGLGVGGEFVILGVAADPLQVPILGLVLQRQSVHGWPSGTSIDSEDTLRFSEITGVRAAIEKYPLDRAQEAYERMMSGKARFRVVLDMTA